MKLKVYIVSALLCASPSPPPPELEDYIRALLDPDSGIPLCDPAQGLFTGENKMAALTTLLLGVVELGL